MFAVCEVPREGAYAEKIAIRQEIVARKPEGLSHVQAAAIALAGLTALISLEETLKLKAGETILIQGGAGGVAGFAIALAKHLGARVITTASAANHAYVRSLGADEVIDYRAQDFTKLVSNCDAVFDTVGGDVTERSFSVLRPGGRLATVAAGAAAPVSPRSDVTSLRPKVEPRPAAPRSRRQACRAENRAAAADRRVSAGRGRRRAPRERGAPFARQAGAPGALTPGRGVSQGSRGMHIIFVHGWSVTHTDTYGELPRWLSQQSRDYKIQNVYLGKYISFVDSVTLDDIARAFQQALYDALGKKMEDGFACITHSTGGPVVRLWMKLYYGAQLTACPMKHLIMLAPANHGSALAQLGKGTFSRFKSLLEGEQPGVRVLDLARARQRAGVEPERVLDRL